MATSLSLFQPPKTFTKTLISSSSPFAPIANLSFAAPNAFRPLRKAPPLALRAAPKLAPTADQGLELLPNDQGSQDLKLFVGNVPFSVDSATLAALFETAGSVEMVEVVHDKLSGRSRGFGFVTMSSVEEVEAAVQQFNGYTLEGRSLWVRRGPPPRKDEPPSKKLESENFKAANRVFVGNLSWNIDKEALERHFSEQGKVVDATVIYDRESGNSRGFGFVSYSSAEEVDNAIATLNGSDLDGRTIRVTLAEKKPPRRRF